MREVNENDGERLPLVPAPATIENSENRLSTPAQISKALGITSLESEDVTTMDAQRGLLGLGGLVGTATLCGERESYVKHFDATSTAIWSLRNLDIRDSVMVGLLFKLISVGESPGESERIGRENMAIANKVPESLEDEESAGRTVSR